MSHASHARPPVRHLTDISYHHNFFFTIIERGVDWWTTCTLACLQKDFLRQIGAWSFVESAAIGVQLFGSFKKIMMLPPPSFVLTTNWLLGGLWTHKKLPTSICYKHRILSPGITMTFLDYQWRFFGVQSLSKSLLVANPKLDGGSIMIFRNDPKSCTPSEAVWRQNVCIGWHLLPNIRYTINFLYQCLATPPFTSWSHLIIFLLLWQKFVHSLDENKIN